MPRPLKAEVQAITGGEAEAVRDHILAAAHRVIARDGLAAASTRAIADEAGLGSGTLYNYFENRTQLLARALVWRASTVAAPLLAALPARAGTDTVASNLLYFARNAATNLDEIIPLVAAAFSDPPLLDALRHELAADTHLHDIGRSLLEYLLAERDLGRIAPATDCHAAASIVFSLCHDQAFQRYVGGESGNPDPAGRQMEFIAGALTSGAPLRDIQENAPGNPAEGSPEP